MKKKIRLRNAIKIGYTSLEDIKESMIYFMFAKELNMKPWEVDKMDATIIDEWLVILNESIDSHGNRR